HAFPIALEQVMRSAAEKAASKAKTATKQAQPVGAKKPPGRPKGSKNKNKAEVKLNPELLRIQGLVQGLLQRMGDFLPLTYLLLDGHFGNHPALHMTRQTGLHLISKLRSDAALYFAYEGPYSGHGPQRKYGDKVDYRRLPAACRKETRLDDRIQTCFYQATLWHKEFNQSLNVVIVVKTHLDTLATAHVVLFSSDLTLAYDQLFAYYCLRFQIEFNFRDAKQFWGLEDFMNTSSTAVTNAANLALFMVNLSYRLLLDFRPTQPAFSVLDLKALATGQRYVTETIQCLPQKPEPVLLAHILRQVSSLGQIHLSPPSSANP
ncbi:MAG: transposase, partial [Leptolyngbyaceae cyanobacterium SU_3_3]|nr:transposase [Leptolyngbyaceae cyanobacterium SU_3_3]